MISPKLILHNWAINYSVSFNLFYRDLVISWLQLPGGCNDNWLDVFCIFDFLFSSVWNPEVQKVSFSKFESRVMNMTPVKLVLNSAESGMHFKRSAFNYLSNDWHLYNYPGFFTGQFLSGTGINCRHSEICTLYWTRYCLDDLCACSFVSGNYYFWSSAVCVRSNNCWYLLAY